MNISRKANIAQIVINLSPGKWVIIPKVGRVTPDMWWVNPSGNYSYIRFLFVDIQIMYY